MGGGEAWQELEAAGRVASAVGERRVLHAGAQFAAFLVSPGPSPMGWRNPSLGRAVPPRLTHSRAQRCVSKSHQTDKLTITPNPFLYFLFGDRREMLL